MEQRAKGETNEVIKKLAQRIVKCWVLLDKESGNEKNGDTTLNYKKVKKSLEKLLASAQNEHGSAKRVFVMYILRLFYKAFDYLDEPLINESEYFLLFEQKEWAKNIDYIILAVLDSMASEKFSIY